MHKQGKIILFSNNGSLYWGKKNQNIYISSESYSLKITNCKEIKKIDHLVELEVPISKEDTLALDHKISRKNLVPEISNFSTYDKLLCYEIKKIFQ